ncbi:ATP-binding cassette domain-containing protein [Hoyosella rhizosphaerae]|uniref:Iron ABC transporter ATP-binding protein n=1 Tax=Hoyosella rhizosphaerae TaxID=1755582 RepID=A0A916UCR4_9ACTN|nr:ATP-binding cassette domain-containing protein [Hoyosella rhizosphaerae]MBN4925816.1 ATP-binding cassette domain-containing protein [Hoyosella rhizosphaerae]GGC67737.1 iron ABC transporter ATP-binding protein [Hoyosella rhizosphaerae]
MIRLKNVTKSFGSTTVVDDVTCEIAPSGITSLIGPNGAGKSTLLSMISRLTPCDAGVITVDGLDVFDTPTDVLARKLSILRQDNAVSVRLTVRELVTFGRYPHSRGRLTVVDKVKIDEAIAYLELESLADRPLEELSGGQRQRAFVAMVLCQDTDYILLDEPLNNLDMRHAVAMMQRLRRAADELGKTIVLVIHDVNFAAAYSDSIIALKGGRIVHSGTPRSVMTAEVMRSIYDMDMRFTEVDGTRLAMYYL